VTKKSAKFPPWLYKPHFNPAFLATEELLHKEKIFSVCEEAKCPNRAECFSKKTATFLLLGNLCTRSCGFCNVQWSKTPLPPDPEEPIKIAKIVQKLSLRHVVLTMVTRDDLQDGGAYILVKAIREIRKQAPLCSIEILSSDFGGNLSSLDLVLNEKIEIFNHNVETVKELSQKIRNKADYQRSLNLLLYAKKSKKTLFVKSGFMVGFGETVEQAKNTLKDLYLHGCDLVTIGQYLRPNSKKLPVKEYVAPEIFKTYEKYGYEIGLKGVFAAPFVRSSYLAEEWKRKLEKHS
jgi:lipoic acid synthetase